ncbi:MAG TPA: methionyl-tRNA formyltransferase [bacterium]|nr:methionyl-tRNA formyltransferase [bacterium]
MKAVFFGTPAFAVPSLDAVLAACELAAVVTQPDRPRGRGLRVEPSPVAVAANQYALDVRQPESLRDPGFLDALRALAPDLLVVVAYGRLIPPAALATARLGGVNLHPSLLPRYRGAAPIPRAIAAGDRETGVTVLHLSDEMDAGDIILQRAAPILSEDTTATLEPRLARAGAALLAEAVRLLDAGAAPRRPQDPSQVSFAPKLSREEALIRWSAPAAAIVNLVRAFDPWPVAYTLRDGEPLKIWRASTAPEALGAVAGVGRARPAPGTVVRAGGGDPPLIVAAGEGWVAVHEVQPASGRRMPVAAYLRGHPLAPGTILGGGATTVDRADPV